MVGRNRLAIALVVACAVAVLGSIMPEGGMVQAAHTELTDRFFVLQWGSMGTTEGLFNGPGGVAAGPSGNVFVADQSNHRIQVFDPDGSFIRTWGWGVQDGSNMFQICTSGCQAGIAGNGAGQLNSPGSVAVDGNGDVFVDGFSEISKFDSDGVFLSRWGSAGTAEGQFQGCCRLATDVSGNVYASDSNNHRVQVFDGDGNFLRMWGWGIDSGVAQLEACTSSCQAGIAGNGNGQFDFPTGVDVDKAGNVAVADGLNHRVQLFTANGGFVTTWGSFGVAEDTFNSPEGVSHDRDGNVYVVDRGNRRVQEFAPDGEFLRAWGWGVQDGASEFQVCTSGCQGGLDGSGAGQFDDPQQLSVDAAGFIYVADSTNQRVQKFAPAFLKQFVAGLENEPRWSSAAVEMPSPLRWFPAVGGPDCP